MTDDIKLLPLPPLYIVPSVEPVEYPNVAQALMDYARDNVAYAITTLQAELVELRAECEKLRKDAERYRWLRDPCSGAERVIFYCRGDYGRGLMSSAMLDAAIDQARGKGEP